MLFNPLLKKRKQSYFTKGGFYCIWTCVGMLVYCGTEEGAEWTRSQINKSEDDLTAVGAEPGHHGECCKHVTTATITQLWARSAILFDKMTTEFFRLKAQVPSKLYSYSAHTWKKSHCLIIHLMVAVVWSFSWCFPGLVFTLRSALGLSSQAEAVKAGQVSGRGVTRGWEDLQRGRGAPRVIFPPVTMTLKDILVPQVVRLMRMVDVITFVNLTDVVILVIITDEALQLWDLTPVAVI